MPTGTTSAAVHIHGQQMPDQANETICVQVRTQTCLYVDTQSQADYTAGVAEDLEAIPPVHSYILR